MELRTRAAVSTYIEVFVLIGVAMAGSALVYGATNSYSAALGGPGVTVSTLSIKQGQQIALLQMQIANTGTTTINSFTTTTSGISPSYPYLVYLDSGNSVTTGLVGYWPMNEGSGTTTADLSGNGNTGTLINSPTWQSGANCKFGNCLLFTAASSQYVSMSAASLPTGSGARTITAWIYVPSLASGWMDVAAYGTPGVAQQTFEFKFDSGSGALAFGGWSDDYTSPLIIGTGAWHFIGVTYVSGATQVTLVLDASSSTGSLSGGVALNTPSSTALYLGRYNGGSYLSAYVDDIRIYNRALSASEVSAIYASSVGSVTQPTTMGPGQSVTVTIIIFSPNAFAIGGRYSVSVSASGAVEQVNGVAVPA